jgi:hypothetical protein
VVSHLSGFKIRTRQQAVLSKPGIRVEKICRNRQPAGPQNTQSIRLRLTREGTAKLRSVASGAMSGPNLTDQFFNTVSGGLLSQGGAPEANKVC